MYLVRDDIINKWNQSNNKLRIENLETVEHPEMYRSAYVIMMAVDVAKV